MMKEYLICHIAALTTGYILDLIVGDPHGIPHPIVWIGRLIGLLEKGLLNKAGDRLDDMQKKRRGTALVIIVMLTTVMLTSAAVFFSYKLDLYFGVFIEAILTCYILAAKSLTKESYKVYDDLKDGDILKAGKDLSMIVGRDTDKLDEDGIIRATVETIAENTSDGVIAPLIYTAVGGPVLGLAYKAVNTMDSMLGYHNDKYEYFGKTAAVTDDVFNFLPSRISALLMILAAFILSVFSKEYDPLNAFRIFKRDRKNHKSPNSAQTESVCAGALGLRLGGASYYGNKLVEKPYIGDEIKKTDIEDIHRAGRLMFTTEAVCLIVTIGVYIICLMAVISTQIK